MVTLLAILRLTRLESSLLAFLAIFLPFLVRTHDLPQSLSRAIPLLFISICTFISNDLDDVERDQVNHPDRPLPSGRITPTFTTILYFSSLGLALFSTRYYIEPDIAFLYYFLIALTISYGYIVDCLTGLKAPYVAAVSSIPILIVATSYPDEMKLYIVATAVFFLNLGREICMDIKDRAGDADSFMRRFKPIPLAIVGFSLQAMGFLLLTIHTHKLGDVIALFTMIFLLALSGIYWFKFTSYKLAILLMKLPFFVGLYFLI